MPREEEKKMQNNIFTPPPCDGDGHFRKRVADARKEKGGIVKCSQCKGLKWVDRNIEMQGAVSGGAPARIPCSHCKGTGEEPRKIKPDAAMAVANLRLKESPKVKLMSAEDYWRSFQKEQEEVRRNLTIDFDEHTATEMLDILKTVSMAAYGQGQLNGRAYQKQETEKEDAGICRGLKDKGYGLEADEQLEEVAKAIESQTKGEENAPDTNTET